jgi:AcrR family transcriptional regulator
MTLSTETEQKIIASAEKLFYRKGKAGTSMQDIADDAGINRTLLNYYFRSKDQLFEAVFKNAMSTFVPNLVNMLNSDMSFKDYVPRLIETVIDAMLENPQIPIFVLQELSSNPDRMPQIIKDLGIDPAVAVKKMESEKWKELGDHMEPRQVILNLLSLCIFPFAARPVVTEILFNGDEDAYIAAMKQRKLILPLLVNKLMIQNRLL